MVWVIPEFPDQTVSLASEKWLRSKDRKCYFPKTNVLSKIRNEVDVDTKTQKWSLHPCRLLFKGERFATYEAARDAEKIAQNHSTMTSFQNSYLAKQVARKRPTVFYSSSSSENESKDFKNIKKLSKSDAGLDLKNKKYDYKRKDNDNHSSPMDSSLNTSFVSDGSRSPEKIDDRSVKSGSVNRDLNDNSSNDSDDNRDGRDGWSVVTGSTNRDSNDNLSDGSDIDNFSEVDENHDVDKSRDGCSVVTGSTNRDSNDNFSEVDENHDVDKSQLTVNESNFRVNMDNNLESTEQLPSPISGYDFNEDRRLVRLEKLLTHACQELELIKADVKEIKKKSSESESVVQNMALICKDLSLEVFACTEEIKKRNGMFTDILVPDIKLPIKRTKQYGDVELALGRHKIVDNLIKYLASTVNETKEKQFIKTSLKVIFGLKFFCTKVWWKKMPKRVLIKNSQILHCMRESFKIKFGLAEPKKTDKEIGKLIYKVSRNVKDSWRKMQKKNEKDEVANQEEDNWYAMQRKGSRKKRVSGNDEEVYRNGNAEPEENVDENKKAAKKLKKAKKQTDEARRGEKDMRASEEDTGAAEENSKERKAKKAAKKARKAKQAAEEAIRAAEEATRTKSQQDGMPKRKTHKAEQDFESESKKSKKSKKKIKNCNVKRVVHEMYIAE